MPVERAGLYLFLPKKAVFEAVADGPLTIQNRVVNG